MVGFLYGQTEYNLLRNSIHLSDYVIKCKEYKLLSITDPNLYAHYKFYKLCKNNNIKPLIGLEINLGDKTFLAYALNEEGYKNICKISSDIAMKKNITINDLYNHSNGIYYITAYDIDIEEFNILKKDLNIGIGVFKDSNDLYNKAISNNIKVFPLLKSAYLENEKNVYEALLKIGNNEPSKYDDKLLDTRELEKAFEGMTEVFKGIEYLYNESNINLDKKQITLPKYPFTKNKSSKEFLYNLCFAGLNKRLSNYKGDKKIYYDRMSYELKIIDEMGYNDYFLIVWDFIKYAKNNKILVGPGRGSAAGSLVAYSIGISSVDPLKYNLYFERFLNPERKTMPDIDTDFPDDKREDVINYVKSVYGNTHVVGITTFGTFKIKSSIRDLGKALGCDDVFINNLSNQIRTYIDDNDNIDFNELINKIDDAKTKEFLFIASRMEGIPRHISTHAAGIILSDEDLYNMIPLQYGVANSIQTQLEAEDCEAIGLLKMDFLGIKNLTIIDDIIKNIDKYNNINIFNTIPLDDKKTYDMLSSGDTLGIFQLEKPGITRTIMDLRPNTFEDIVAILALYRPGPMDNIGEYIKRKNGTPFKYIHDDLKDILKDTYGIIVYQEQIMQIARKFAGYTLGAADILRRAVSKKKEDVLKEERDKFVLSSINMGYDKDIANKIYDDIVKFADYGFNKSHSVVYALFSYTMAYLKANYKELFIESALTNVIGSVDETKNYISYAKRKNIVVSSPNINISTDKYVYQDNKIYMPLTAIKGIGKNIVSKILSERENGLFKSYEDFKIRINIPTNILESLIFVDAFIEFGKTKKNMIDSIDEKDEILNLFLEGKKDIKEEFDDEYLQGKEKEALGFNLIYNKYKNIDIYRKKYNCNNLSDIEINKRVKLIGSIIDYKEIKTKDNSYMLVGDFEDDRTSISMVLFPQEYAKYKKLINRNNLLIIDGIIKNNEKKGKQLVINNVEKL